MEFNKNQDYWATCYSTPEFLSIETYSGLGRIRRDPQFESHLLPVDVEAERLGATVLKALSDSRTLNVLEERIEFFDLNKGKELYAQWTAMLMEKYSYKTKKMLFKDMMSCGIHLFDDQITIRPSYHEKLEAWSGNRINESDYVVLPLKSSYEEIGLGLRLAMSRCKG